MGYFKEKGPIKTGDLFEKKESENTGKKEELTDLQKEGSQESIADTASQVLTKEESMVTKKEEEKDDLEQAVIETLKRGYDQKSRNFVYRALDVYFAGGHDMQHWRQMQEEMRGQKANKEFRYLIVKIKGILKKLERENKIGEN